MLDRDALLKLDGLRGDARGQTDDETRTDDEQRPIADDEILTRANIMSRFNHGLNDAITIHL